MMMNMIESIVTAGVSPALSDVLTDENIAHNQMVQNIIYFCCDPAPLEPTNSIEDMAHSVLSEGYTWSTDHMRGILVGIVMALTNDDVETGELYRLIGAMILEKAIE